MYVLRFSHRSGTSGQSVVLTIDGRGRNQAVHTCGVSSTFELGSRQPSRTDCIEGSDAHRVVVRHSASCANCRDAATKTPALENTTGWRREGTRGWSLLA